MEIQDFTGTRKVLEVLKKSLHILIVIGIVFFLGFVIVKAIKVDDTDFWAMVSAIGTPLALAIWGWHSEDKKSKRAEKHRIFSTKIEYYKNMVQPIINRIKQLEERMQVIIEKREQVWEEEDKGKAANIILVEMIQGIELYNIRVLEIILQPGIDNYEIFKLCIQEMKKYHRILHCILNKQKINYNIFTACCGYIKTLSMLTEFINRIAYELPAYDINVIRKYVSSSTRVLQKIKKIAGITDDDIKESDSRIIKINY